MTQPASTPVLSATILLVRDGLSGLEVLMVERHYEIDFAAGALVFPGGKACADDRRDAWRDASDGAAEGEELAAQVAAIRELYEEAGVLLARPVDARGEGRALCEVSVVDGLQPFRGEVDRGERSFYELMETHGLVLACDALVHFGHWITPEMMPKRFDTHFYVAAAPEGQTALQDGRETTLAVWLGPQRALEAEAAGERVIIFPTRMNLGRLALVSGVAEAMAKFAAEPVVTVLPYLEPDAEHGTVLVIPEVEGYGQTREPVGRVANVSKPKS